MAIIELTTPTENVEEAREELFSIDGTAYTIPKNPSASIALKYLRLTRSRGHDVSVGWMLEEMLGADGYDALMNFEALEPAQLSSIVQIIQARVIGAMEGASAPLV